MDQSWIGRDVLGLTRFGGYADVVVVPERNRSSRTGLALLQTSRGNPGELPHRVAVARGYGLAETPETVLVHDAGGGHQASTAIDIARHISTTESTKRQAAASTPS